LLYTQKLTGVKTSGSMGKNKFYAVRKGHSTGIFTDWPTCQQATAGFRGAEFKSFPTRQEAEAYLRGGSSAGPYQQPQQQQGFSAASRGPGGPAGQRKFFAVVRGHRTGVFEGLWDDVQPLVAG
jgi:viroplasmin and RNaseH domain-containing protein